MKKPIDLLDTDFDHDITGLYVVIDTTTNLEVSSVLQMRNDIVAVESFNRFLKEQKNKAPYSHYLLRHIGYYSVISHNVMQPVEPYDIVDESEDVENYLKLIVEHLKHKEQED